MPPDRRADQLAFLTAAVAQKDAKLAALRAELRAAQALIQNLQAALAEERRAARRAGGVSAPPV